MLKTQGPGFKKFKKRFRRSLLPKLSGIDTDLDFTGITKGFASLSQGLHKPPTGECVQRSSYETCDVHVPLADDHILHVLPTKRGDFKISLISENETTEQTLASVYANRGIIEKIIYRRIFEMNGQVLGLLDVRPLKRMLSRVSLSPTIL